MKTRLRLFCVAFLLGLLLSSGACAADLPVLALQPARMITEIGPEHHKSTRGSQGVRAIERTAKGRLWAPWCTAKSKTGVESSSSYVVLATSGDDGATWTGGLLLDERACSYPDATIAAGGMIRVIYDHQRYTDRGPDNKGVGAVMIAVLGEEDVRAGKPVNAETRLRVTVSQLRSVD